MSKNKNDPAIDFAFRETSELVEKAMRPAVIIPTAMVVGFLNFGGHFYAASQKDKDLIDLKCIAQPYAEQEGCFAQEDKHNNPIHIQKLEILTSGTKRSLGIMGAGIVAAFALSAWRRRKIPKAMTDAMTAYDEKGTAFRQGDASNVHVIDGDKPSNGM
ncbi:MAG: hypothetical protein ACRBCT_02130 [Alphaproteobacteria bacterium]